MRRTCRIALACCWMLVAAVVLGAQARPNFSGAWVLARDRSSQTMRGSVTMSIVGLLGEKFTATQDEKVLRLVISALGREIPAVYLLDGSESQNMNPRGPGQPDEPIFSKASWEGDRLVILTRGTALVDGKPVESKRVIWIDAEGLLIIERSAGSATTRSVYRRAPISGTIKQ